MDTNLLYKDEVYSIIGSSMEVLNELGHGLNEKTYENALVVDFKLKEMHFAQQKQYSVIYKNFEVGKYIPDLVLDNKIIVDTKVIPKITNLERGQILNYLKILKLKLGLIINFKKPTLEWERLVLERGMS